MKLQLYILLVFGFAVAIIQNGCANSFSSATSLSGFSSAQCNSILQAEFEKPGGYHSFLRDNCASCHTVGGSGNGGFADSVSSQAFDQFAVRGPNLVGARAVDPNHVNGVTGPQHQNAIDDLKADWQDAQARFDACLANSGSNTDNDNSGEGPGILPDDPTFTEARLQTTAKTINANANTPTQITWNLGQDLPGNPLSGAQLSVDMTTFTTPTGDTSYILSNLRLSTGSQALHLIYIDVSINNTTVLSATTYKTVNRRLEAGASALINSANMVIPVSAINPTDTVSLGIGQITPISFAPQSYSQLASGILGQNCASCHAQGGANQDDWDMTNYNELFSRGKVSPFSPNGSRLFIRMNDSENPMPPSGLLPQQNIDAVRDWIWDGAPQN